MPLPSSVLALQTGLGVLANPLTAEKEDLQPFAQSFDTALVDTEDAEVEIARLELASTTFDVTALFAKFANGQIYLRVVDEYEGATLTRPSEMKSERPLTLGEMNFFFERVVSD